MNLPRHTNHSPRRGAFSQGWLDPSSAWALDEYAVTLPVASEPYDWTLEDDPVPFPQFVPVPPPTWGGPAMPRPARRKANLSEAAILIPIRRANPRRKRLVSSVLLLLLSVAALFIFTYIAQKYGR